MYISIYAISKHNPTLPELPESSKQNQSALAYCKRHLGTDSVCRVVMETGQEVFDDCVIQLLKQTGNSLFLDEVPITNVITNISRADLEKFGQKQNTVIELRDTLDNSVYFFNNRGKAFTPALFGRCYGYISLGFGPPFARGKLKVDPEYQFVVPSLTQIPSKFNLPAYNNRVYRYQTATRLEIGTDYMRKQGFVICGVSNINSDATQYYGTQVVYCR